MIVETVQVWFADRGYGQYPLPRRQGPSLIGLRLVIGALSIFGLALLLPFFALLCTVIFVFVRAALGI